MIKKQANFGVMNLTSDFGILFGIVSIIGSIYFYVSGSESITANNLLYTFIASTLLFSCYLVG